MIIQQIVNGLAIGTVYAIVAVGYSLVFGVLNMMNMAHASIFALGAHFIYTFGITLGLGEIPGLIISVLLTGIICVVYDKTILAPLRKTEGGSGVVVLITGFGVQYFLLNMLMILWGSEYKAFPNIFNLGTITIGGVGFDSTQLFMLLIAVILLICLTLIVYKTKLGLGMRAIQQNAKAAKLMGVNVSRTIAATFFLSGVMAVVASFLVASYYQLVYYTMGSTLGTKAFAAAVLGGIGILHGSVVGGLLIGVAECITVYFFGGTYRDAVAFCVLILVLLFKPTGLFGKKVNVKV